jgi:hypothetical protein
MFCFFFDRKCFMLFLAQKASAPPRAGALLGKPGEFRHRLSNFVIRPVAVLPKCIFFPRLSKALCMAL